MLVVTLSALVVATGCANGSRDLREPPPGATAPLRSTSSTAATVVPSSLPEGFLLTSPVFQPGEPLPSVNTCVGEGESVPLVWYGVPADTTELAVVVQDRTDADTVNWVVAGIPPTETGLTPGALPAAAIEGLSTAGTIGYDPPCPPAGEQHTYDITLFALTAPTGLAPGASPEDALAVIESQSNTRTILTATVDG